jgi:hypothetical protein
LRALAESATAPRGLRANTHVHLPPNFSAFSSATEAVSLAASAGLDILGAGNYYDFAVYRAFANEARRHAVFPVFGAEIICMLEEEKAAGVRVNDPGNAGRMYICTKGMTRFDPLSPAAERTLGAVRRADGDRMRRMIGHLNAVFADNGFQAGLDEAAVIDLVIARSSCERGSVTLQERHLALAFQEVLFAWLGAAQRRELFSRMFENDAARAAENAAAAQGLIRSQLMKSGRRAFVREHFIGLDEARALALELGGVPCYPVLADGAVGFCEFEKDVEALIERIQRMGFRCAEFIPVRNRGEVLARYVPAMRAAGLFVTAGTEHNTLDLLPLEPTAAEGAAIPPEVAGIFREGALVVAAHQYLSAHGETGFVDGGGMPNSSYATDHERIESFASLGAVVLEHYKWACEGRTG